MTSQTIQPPKQDLNNENTNRHSNSKRELCYNGPQIQQVLLGMQLPLWPGKQVCQLQTFTSLSGPPSQIPRLIPTSATKHLLQSPFLPCTHLQWFLQIFLSKPLSPHSCFVPAPNASKHSLGITDESSHGNLQAKSRSSPLPSFSQIQSPSLTHKYALEHPLRHFVTPAPPTPPHPRHFHQTTEIFPS